jgi:SAM-dependent methyltransferase
VLEIGCGSGQLTRSLLARGLRVTALEPGRNLIMLARQNLEGAGPVEFENARFEDAALPHGQFRAVFAASAVHWVDPGVGWRKIADVLAPDGTLALLSYFGLDEQRSSGDQEAAGRRHATLAGAQQRQANVSAMWAWLGSYDLAQDYAGPLFDDAQIAVMPKLVEHTADELNAVIATRSH